MLVLANEEVAGVLAATVPLGMPSIGEGRTSPWLEAIAGIRSVCALSHVCPLSYGCAALGAVASSCCPAAARIRRSPGVSLGS